MALLLSLLLSARTFHPVSVANLPTSVHTHVSVCGVATLVKHEADGDWHLRLEHGGRFIVAEIVPELPRAVPKKGQTITVKGISREDKAHRWHEIHPVLSWTTTASCR